MTGRRSFIMNGMALGVRGRTGRMGGLTEACAGLHEDQHGEDGEQPFHTLSVRRGGRMAKAAAPPA